MTWVWVDALINYLSALTYARPGEDLRDVYWPEVRTSSARTSCACTACSGRRCSSRRATRSPKQIFVHGYLLLDDRKISKPLGNVIDPLDLTSVYGVDPVASGPRAVPFGQDGAVSIEGVHERYERELGNDLGNLLSRTTAMLARYRDGRIPEGRAGSSRDARRAARRPSSSGSTSSTSRARSRRSGRSSAR